MSELQRLWRILISLAVAGLYFGGYMVSIENDRMMVEHEKTVAILQDQCQEMSDAIKANRKGKRNTYCDQIRHLVSDHGYPTRLLDECRNAPITDLQQTLSRIE